MNRRSVALGAFVVIALGLAVVLVTALGKGRFFGGGRTQAVVWFDKSVKGLTIGAPVTFRGVPVGQVEAIGVELDPQSLQSRLPITLAAPRPIDEAISTAGGVRFEALDEHLMLRAMPGVFCAGEMLDWEAPTGGYLLSATLATALVAAQGIDRHLIAGG